MSLDIFCLVILLFFLFGLAVSASEEDYSYYPRKLPEPWKFNTEEDKDDDSDE